MTDTAATDIPGSEMTPSRMIKGDIEAYEREYRPWMDRGNGILQRYRDERNETPNTNYIVRKFNILWSNTETLKPTLYARLPKLAVERRFKDKDPIGRIACEITERMGDYLLQTTSANEVFKQCVQDRLLPGRGQLWVNYYADGNDKEKAVIDQDSGEEVKNDDGTPKVETEFEKIQETVCLEYVDYRDFGHSPMRTWEEVTKKGRVWLKTYMTEAQLEQRWPDKFKEIPLDRKPREAEGSIKTDYIIPQATIYQVYDATDKKVRWVHKEMQDCILEEMDPYVNLEGFFPCPSPLFATLTNGTLIPVADFIFYQDQANELDIVTNRISRLTDALKVVGAYDASQPALERILQNQGDENKLVPVDNWALMAEKGGVPNAISLVPVDMVLTVLQGLVQVREQIIQIIYQVTGIADIIRGATNPNETATAQQIKGQFASLRIKDTQQDVARFCRDAARLMIECAVELFEPKTIWEMTQAESFCQPNQQDQQMAMAAQMQGQPAPYPQVFTQAIQLLRDDKLRSFHIDIETDSTIAMDEQQDKQDATEFLTAVGGFMKEGAIMIQQAPETAELFGEMLMFVTRRFRAGRTLEGTIERTMDAMKQRIQQQMQNPPPNPEMKKVENEAKADEAKLKLQAANDQQEGQRKVQEAQQDAQIEVGKVHLQTRVKAAEALSKVAPASGAAELSRIAQGA